MAANPEAAEATAKKRPPFFWWTLVNTFAIALAIASWLICLNLFEDPTHPLSYQMMLKVKRLEPLEDFTPNTAPSPSHASDPTSLEAEFQRFSQEDLDLLNQEYLKAYLTNYEKGKHLIYVTGDYQILTVRKLQSSDLLSSGAVLKAQALVRPGDLADPLPYPLFIEVFYPGDPALAEKFQVGETLTLKRSPDSAAIINVSRQEADGRKALFFTLVALATDDPRVFPPKSVRVDASLPRLK